MSEALNGQSLYSKIYRTGYKTYYFDIRESNKKTKYLTIAESRIQDGERTRTYFIIFPEQLNEFVEILKDMQNKII